MSTSYVGCSKINLYRDLSPLWDKVILQIDLFYFKVQKLGNFLVFLMLLHFRLFIKLIFVFNYITPQNKIKQLKQKEMDKGQLARFLQFEWMKTIGPKCDCRIMIHPGISCMQEISIKLISVAKMASKFYFLVHLIPYLLQIKKFKDATLKRLKNFMGSVGFMLQTVVCHKIMLCLLTQFDLGVSGKTFVVTSPLSSLSILWQSRFRREQIALFAFVRSLRSAYIFFNRRKILQIPKQFEIAFVAIFGALSYMFMQQKSCLKYSNYIEGIWGKI